MYRSQYSDECLVFDLLERSVHKSPDINVGPVPYPVLVGELSVGDYPGFLKFDECLVGVAVNELEQLLRCSDRSGG